MKNRQKCERKGTSQYLNDQNRRLWDERQELYRRLCDAGMRNGMARKSKPVKKMRGAMKKMRSGGMAVKKMRGGASVLSKKPGNHEKGLKARSKGQKGKGLQGAKRCS